MIGVWLEGGELRVRDDLPLPEPAESEALVRIAAAGICGTDLELLRGYRPFAGVPGHELAGVVERGPEPWLGARVVAEINVTCRSRSAADPCPHCRAGRPRHCAHRRVVGIDGRDGAFAEYAALPIANLHRVPEAVSDEAATFVEPLAAALRILAQVEPPGEERALVVGFGRLGQLVARGLAAAGVEVDAIARSPRPRGPLAELGTRLFRPDAAPEGAYGLAVDCTGSPDGFGLARRALRPGGTLVLKSTYAGDLILDASALVVDEIRVVGSRCGPFPPALAAIASGRVPVLDLIDARFPIAEALAAFELAGRRGVAKVLLHP